MTEEELRKASRYPEPEDAIAFLVKQGAKAKSLSLEFNGPRSLRVLGALDRLRKTHIVMMGTETVTVVRRPLTTKEAA